MKRGAEVNLRIQETDSTRTPEKEHGSLLCGVAMEGGCVSGQDPEMDNGNICGFVENIFESPGLANNFPRHGGRIRQARQP